jgi:hypothetical protein
MSKTMKNAIYVGELIDGRRDGRGSCRWADGNLYEGEWRGECVGAWGWGQGGGVIPLGLALGCSDDSIRSIGHEHWSID